MTPKALKGYRRQFEMTREELARELCVSYWTIVSWELGRRPMPLCCQKLFCLLHDLEFDVPDYVLDNLDQMNFEF